MAKKCKKKLKLQDGGRIDFPGVKYANPYLVPEHNIPMVNNVILPNKNRAQLYGTNASEYKIGVGFDGNNVTIPRVVGGQLLNQQGAIDRYKATGNKFKEMSNPSSYSQHYDMINRLGIQSKAKGGQIINNNMIRKGFKSKMTPHLANGGAATLQYTDPNVVNTDFNYGSVATGALSGAATGLTVGGPWGALVGGVVGAGAGIFGANKEQQAALAQRDEILKSNRASRANYDRSRMNMLDNSIGTPYSYFKMGGKVGYRLGGQFHTMPDGTVHPGATHADYIAGKTKRVGVGTEVKGRKGTDTINANIDGQNVMLDNNEIIVRDRLGNPVVLSDDIGTADKYRQRVAKGANPQVEAFRLAEEAKALNPNPTGVGRQIEGLTSRQFTGSLAINEDPSFMRRRFIDVNPNLPTMTPIQSRGISTQEPVIAQRTLTNPTPPRDFRATVRQGINNVGDFVRDNPQGVAEGLGFAATTIGNINAANRLNKTRMAAPRYARTLPLDPNVNRPLYENQIGDIRRSGRNLASQTLANTSSSPTALARLNAIRANEQNAINRVSSQQVADRGNIINRNIADINRTGLFNTQLANQYNQNLYQDQLGRINTQLGLTGSTVSSLNNIIENVRKGNFQKEQLQALSNRYNLGLDANRNSVQDFITALNNLTGEELRTAIQ